MVEIYRKPLFDLISRQTKLVEMVSADSLSSVGVSLSIGKNFCATSHFDSDMGYSFG